MVEKMTNEEKPILTLRGPARLDFMGKTLKVQRKSLALLYYLALEGVTRREKIAELLWGGPSSANSLRVELSKLRSTLRSLGFVAFETENPLNLPEAIQVIPGSETGEFLEGLDDINSDFQIWLDAQRAKLENQQKPTIRKRLIQQTAERINMPHLIFLRGQPASGRFEFAQRLASQLDMPLIEGPLGQTRALRYFREPLSLAPDMLHRIVEDKENIWVIECSAFGEDSSSVLRLRESYPPDRTLYLDLPPLSWNEARDHFLKDIPFGEAARLYMASGGHISFLDELIQLRPPEGYTGAMPTLRRVQARYKLEARYLSREARYMLEKLSIHPGALPQEFLNTFGATPHLDELERRGWLVFDEGWHFVNETVRQIMYDVLKPGQRQRYHREAASYFSLAGNVMAVAHHSFMLGDSFEWDSILNYADSWKRLSLQSKLGESLPEAAPIKDNFAMGESLALLETQRYGEGLTEDAGQLTLLRNPTELAESGIEWQLPEEASILTISSQVYFRNALVIGMNGEATPLKLELFGSQKQTIYFADVAKPCLDEDGAIVLPLDETFRYHFHVKGFSHVSLESKAENAVMEIDLLVNQAIPAKQAQGAELIQAYVFDTESAEAQAKIKENTNRNKITLTDINPVDALSRN